MSTIAAISTATGDAAIGVVRLSGDRSHEIAAGVFDNMPKGKRKIAVGNIYDEGGQIDKAVLTLWTAPHSYTGENMAEFSCHGGMVVLRSVMAALIKEGCEPAPPGEFTKRAFINGKLDLAESEAVIELIMATSSAAARAALSASGGALSRIIREVRGSLISVDADIMAFIDFSSEGIEEPEPSDILKGLDEGKTKLLKLIDTAERGQVVSKGAPCALLGKPNVGKSSVMNLLSGADKSIVTEIEGTTRDVVEHHVEIGGLLLRLMDTAGLRDSDDVIEQMGVERSKKAAAQASLLIGVFDGSREIEQGDLEVMELCKGRPSVALVNKCDLGFELESDKFEGYFDRVIRFSALTGEGLSELEDHLAKLYLPRDGEVLMTSLRHEAAARRALSHIEAAHAAISSGELPDMAELDIRAAIEALGEITGETASDDIIGDIFSRFCVGK